MTEKVLPRSITTDYHKLVQPLTLTAAAESEDAGGLSPVILFVLKVHVSCLLLVSGNKYALQGAAGTLHERRACFTQFSNCSADGV